jgi:hypothetical protein
VGQGRWQKFFVAGVPHPWQFTGEIHAAPGSPQSASRWHSTVGQNTVPPQCGAFPVVILQMQVPPPQRLSFPPAQKLSSKEQVPRS